LDALAKAVRHHAARWIPLLCLCWATPSFAWQWTFAGGVEYFTWIERTESDRELVRETGPRLSLSASVSDERSVVGGRYRELFGQLHYGEVDYDGETMQTSETLNSTTDYLGGGAEGVLGYRWADLFAPGVALDAAVSFGYEGWGRDILPSRTAAGTPVSGLYEVYHILYARLGVGPTLSAAGWRGRAQLGLRLPVYTYERAETSTIGCEDDVELRPDPRGSAFARLSAEWPRGQRALRLEMYYDSFRFGPSELEPTTCLRSGTPVGLLFQQPRSSLDVLGLRLGILF
jgi:hypothetical protein